MSSNKLIDEFERLPTAIISDALNGSNTMNAEIRAITQGLHIAGPALTVRCFPGDESTLAVAIQKHAKKGDVIVVCGHGVTESEYGGGIMARFCIHKGVKGMVIDGVTRDFEDLRELRFPVFCRGFHPRSAAHQTLGQINVPISCGGVAIYPGDIIVGDDDGVVVIPKDIAEKILDKSKKCAAVEEEIKDALDKGKLDIDDLLQKLEETWHTEPYLSLSR
jgi:4-hydroxy-4-methyl-2-oxoglutarate aldolase